MKFAQQLLLLCLAGLALGCGQKGPLVMPDAQKHKRTLPTIPGAPAKPAAGGGNTAPAPQGGGTAATPTPPAASPTPASPTTPPLADSAHP